MRICSRSIIGAATSLARNSFKLSSVEALSTITIS
jgi:hypothetical protein